MYYNYYKIKRLQFHMIFYKYLQQNSIYFRANSLTIHYLILSYLRVTISIFRLLSMTCLRIAFAISQLHESHPLSLRGSIAILLMYYRRWYRTIFGVSLWEALTMGYYRWEYFWWILWIGLKAYGLRAEDSTYQ